jgi:putative flavoprotein involved in K+ transport
MVMYVDTVVIGGGAAGLRVGRRLSVRGIPFTILDDQERIGDSWRERYRSLRLFTPRTLAELPGLRLDIGFFSFPTGTEYADYLERYAERFSLPVRLSTRVTALTREVDGRFHVSVSQGEEVLAERVIVTVGAHRVAVTPTFAASLDSGIRQLHSVDYEGPEQFADGPVLVVGAANSGTDIALEAAAAGHTVTVAGRHPGEIPIDIDTPVGNLLSRVFIRRLRRTTIDTARGRAVREDGRGHGVNLVRNTVRDLERAGIARVGRMTGVDDAGRPVIADHGAIAASTVVWCTGSRPEFGWIAIDGALGPEGRPDEYRGIVEGVPGLAFVGLPFQYSPMSSTLMGMGVDADYVVDRLCSEPARARAVTPARAS